MSKWELKEKSMGEMTVTVDGEKWEKAVKKAFNKIAANFSAAGFRKGKAPRSVVERNVSAAQVQYQAVEENANDWMLDGLTELNLNPLTQPQLDIKAIGADAVTLGFTFAVKPEPKLGDYKSLEYKVEESEVTDEELNEELNRRRERYADNVVKEGAAENGDIVNIDYKGFKDGEAFEGGSAEGYDLTLGSGSFIPGFEEQLVGVKAGDEKDLNLTFPEDYHAEDLKGAEVVFKVKVNEVKTKVLPELDDDFAADQQIADVETAEDLKKYVRERLAASKKDAAVSKAENKLAEDLAAMTEADIPDVMIDEEIQGQVGQMQSQLQQYGMSLTQYLSMIGQTAESWKESLKEQAEKTVKVRLGLEAVAKAEGIEVSQEDLDKEYQNIADMYSMEVDKVKEILDSDMMKTDILNQKAMKFLKGEAE